MRDSICRLDRGEQAKESKNQMKGKEASDPQLIPKSPQIDQKLNPKFKFVNFVEIARQFKISQIIQ